MTALDRNGQTIDLGDYVSFQFADEPVTAMRVAAITDAANPGTPAHHTLILTGGFQIDSLSVQRVEPPAQSETSKYLEQLTQGPIRPIAPDPIPKPKPRIPPPGPERLIEKDGLPYSKSVTTSKPTPSHKKTVKPTKKGTRS